MGCRQQDICSEFIQNEAEAPSLNNTRTQGPGTKIAIQMFDGFVTSPGRLVWPDVPSFCLYVAELVICHFCRVGSREKLISTKFGRRFSWGITDWTQATAATADAGLI